VTRIEAEGNEVQGTLGGSFAVVGVRMFDGDRVFPRASVTVDNGVIATVSVDTSAPAGVDVVDGSNSTLLPGLIDSHVHAWGPLDRVLRRNLLFGVTTALEMMCDGDGLAEVRAAQKADAPDEAQILSSGFAVTVPDGHGTEYGFAVPTIEDAAAAQEFVDARIAEGSDYIKIMFSDRSLRHVPSLALLQSAVDAAHRRNKQAIVHIVTQRAADDAIAAGADGLAHLFFDPPDPGLGERVAAAGTFVIPTLTVLESKERPSGATLLHDPHIAPLLNAYDRRQLALDGPTLRAQRGLPMRQAPADWSYENARRAVALLRATRVPILAGTDAGNAGTTHGASIHRELELLVDAGLTRLEALAAATSAPARCFGMHDRGRIAPGLRADLLLVDGDPTVDITRTRAIRRVWKAGVELVRRGPATGGIDAG
jgi:imidazolonepropionase-like amidohydrolase